MSQKSRLEKLEKAASERLYKTPEVVEVWGTHPSGERYLIDSWKTFVSAMIAGEIDQKDFDRLTTETTD